MASKIKTTTVKAEGNQAKQNNSFVQNVVGVGAVAWTTAFAGVVYHGITNGHQIETAIAVVWGSTVSLGLVGFYAWLGLETKNETKNLLRKELVAESEKTKQPE